ncbi:MAG TPA: chromosome segregation protein SMC, partial [Actinobacteria bacterium]|nr:chromosome segregation protein SMC [Actinomycetota bacterium]
NDLTNGKVSITKIIRAIDQKIKEKLLVAFEEVSISFKQMFGRLFPGGKAELSLTGENIFEGGLEIKAQPYGKSTKTLSLLSGGETALTALALLFAVYHTRPSPFYVLDEVEAALDDINLQRFIRLLKDMKKKTQFIVITHQRRTMEVADCLYGVTMQADGISKVVSQRIDEAKDEIANAEELSVS